jgi:elongator complex protein 4
VLGHSGLSLGTSLLVEEVGTTEFAGVLIRYYAAEGLVQGHHVHVLGPGQAWVRELPGLIRNPGTSQASAGRVSDEKMKIAWRYEALQNRATATRGAFVVFFVPNVNAFLTRY